MCERLELPPEAGAWQVEVRAETACLTRGEADDLGALPRSGFSCPEEALPDLVVVLKLIERTAAYQESARSSNGPCGITLYVGRARIHVPVITHGVGRDFRWQKASAVEIRFGEVALTRRRVESLLDGTYGQPAQEWL